MNLKIKKQEKFWFEKEFFLIYFFIDPFEHGLKEKRPAPRGFLPAHRERPAKVQRDIRLLRANRGPGDISSVRRCSVCFGFELKKNLEISVDFPANAFFDYIYDTAQSCPPPPSHSVGIGFHDSHETRHWIMSVTRGLSDAFFREISCGAAGKREVGVR